MNKKRWIYLCCFLGLVVAVGFTINSLRGGYKGPAAPGAVQTTVAEVATLPDESSVVLKGKIDSSLGDEKYLFSDSSGSITVEIERGIWRGLSADENAEVEITGEIDWDDRGIEVEVRSIKV